MKIAVSAQKPGPDSAVDPRFGRAGYFVMYDDEKNTWKTVDNKQNLQASQGAGIQSASHIVNAGAAVLICGHCGPKAFTVLRNAGVAVYSATAGTVAEAVESFKRGALKKLDSADVEGHW